MHLGSVQRYNDIGGGIRCAEAIELEDVFFEMLVLSFVNTMLFIKPRNWAKADWAGTGVKEFGLA